MDFFFPKTRVEDVVEEVEKAMGGRKLSEMVSFQVDGSELKVVISKLGTSTLLFSSRKEKNGLNFELKKEKIALAHKAFKGDVTSKLMGVIEKSGGKILSS